MPIILFLCCSRSKVVKGFWHSHKHTTICPGGGIGRRAWFRSMCLRVWRFESSPGHHKFLKKPIIARWSAFCFVCPKNWGSRLFEDEKGRVYRSDGGCIRCCDPSQYDVPSITRSKKSAGPICPPLSTSSSPSISSSPWQMQAATPGLTKSR